MAEFDNPFQMDEDIKTPATCNSDTALPSGNDKHYPYDQHHDRYPAQNQDQNQPYNQKKEQNSLEAFSEDKPLSTDKSRPPEPQNIRSRLALLKFEENPGTTTEEDEIVYDEDIDDKFTKADTAKWAQEVADGEEAKNEPLAPPENFAPVVNQIYRSSFPQPANFPFLRKLKLKSVLCLIPEEYPQSHRDFFEHEGIELFQLGMSGNKEPFVIISSDLITEAMKIVLNPANHPILIHCNRGKHRTGCLVGVLRRLQGWSLTIIFDEYRKFAAPKERPMDQQFIELYNGERILEFAYENKFLPLPWD